MDGQLPGIDPFQIDMPCIVTGKVVAIDRQCRLILIKGRRQVDVASTYSGSETSDSAEKFQRPQRQDLLPFT